MEQVFEFIRKYNMIEERDKVIVGISGGADSVCLLFLLKKYQKVLAFSLEAVHVEHGIRGKESLEDAAFVKGMCKELNIPFHMVPMDVKGRAKKQGMSIEEAGRISRYEAFENYKRKLGATKIAVAHNENDQAETVLWNLIRGSGLRGMGGIHPINGTIIRPLLETSRSEIEFWLKQQNISYRTDETNLEETYTRNKLRLKVLPYLEQELNAKAAEHMAQTGRQLQKAEAYLEEQTREKAKGIAKVFREEVWLNKIEFLREEEIIQEYLIRYAIRETGVGLKNVTNRHIQDIRIMAAGRTGARLDLPGSLTAENTGKYLRIALKQKEAHSRRKSQPVVLNVSGESCFENWTVITEIEYYKNQIIPEKKYTKWFDYDKIENTIQIRNREQGDYLIINKKGQRKKLKDYFIDIKIPRTEREWLPLLADGSNIIWCVGYRISEFYKITEHTKRMLKVQFLEEKENEG